MREGSSARTVPGSDTPPSGTLRIRITPAAADPAASPAANPNQKRVRRTAFVLITRPFTASSIEDVRTDLRKQLHRRLPPIHIDMDLMKTLWHVAPRHARASSP